jgi:DNA-binding transcriptional LysR family regulator
MELYQIRYFVALCETLNFARAAERCRVSSPSLTRAVQSLEHELGGLLIRRERRLTHLTELGQLVRPRLEEVLAQTESTKTAAHLFVEAEEKPLRLGIMPLLGPLCLAPFLARFGVGHPGIEIALVEGEAARLEELLLDGVSTSQSVRRRNLATRGCGTSGSIAKASSWFFPWATVSRLGRACVWSTSRARISS